MNSDKKASNKKKRIQIVERKATSQVRNLKPLPAKDRKSSNNSKVLNRGKTTGTKNPHLISLTGSEANKLEFPIKINRKNKVIREKLRMKYLEAVK